MAKKEIVETNANLPAELSDWDDFAGAGYEDTSSDDYAIPMVYVLQALSPACQDGNARPGEIYISSIDAFIPKDEGLRFIPVTTRHNFVEWTPKDQGGGIVGQYPATDPIVLRAKDGGEFGKLKSDDGNDLVETFYIYAMAFPGTAPIEETTPMQVLIPITSTKIKPYKGWRARLRQETFKAGPNAGKPLPLFAHISVLKTVQTENQHGKFYTVSFEYANGSAKDSRVSPNSDIGQACVAFHGAINDGAVKVDMEAGREAAEGTGSTNKGGGSSSDDIPV